LIELAQVGVGADQLLSLRCLAFFDLAQKTHIENDNLERAIANRANFVDGERLKAGDEHVGVIKVVDVALLLAQHQLILDRAREEGRDAVLRRQRDATMKRTNAYSSKLRVLGNAIGCTMG
jgi:hypothetical protein